MFWYICITLFYIHPFICLRVIRHSYIKSYILLNTAAGAGRNYCSLEVVEFNMRRASTRFTLCIHPTAVEIFA